jgi:hypothetical protein
MLAEMILYSDHGFTAHGRQEDCKSIVLQATMLFPYNIFEFLAVPEKFVNSNKAF